MFKLIGKMLLLTGIAMSARSVCGQALIQVYSRDEHKPLPYASVSYSEISGKNKQNGYTDASGKFSIPARFTSENPVMLIQISYLGYENLNDTLRGATEKRYYLQAKNRNLQEVVVTAQYGPGRPENSVHKIRVVDQEKISAMAAVNLKDVLTNELNIRLEQDNILGSSMSMQGLSGENVKIMIDGVPVIGRLNGNIDLSQLNLNDVERIEIVEGPLSVNYGTNALAGTINIITKKNSLSKNSVSITSYNENIGTFNVNGAAAFRRKAHRVSISGLRNYFDGWNSTDPFWPDFEKKIADDGRFKQWKQREQYSGRLQYNYQFRNLLLGYKGEYFHEKITNRGKPETPYKETAFDDYYYTKRMDNAIYLEGAVSEDRNLNFVAAYNRYERRKNTYLNYLPTLEKKLSLGSGAQDTSNFEQVMSRASLATTKENSFLNYEVGYDVNYETATGARIENNWQEQGDFAAFATAELKALKKVIVKPGLRYGYNTVYHAPLIPSLNMKADLGKVVMRASYARGFRAPSLKEVYFNFFDINHNIKGNPDLQAEHSSNYTLGFTHTYNLKQNRSVRTEVTTFFNDIENLITLAQVDSVNYAYVNIGNNQTTGGTLNLAFSSKKLTLNLGGSYTGRYNAISEDIDDVKRYNFSPEIRANALYRWEKPALQIGAYYKYQGRLSGFYLNGDGKLIETMLDSYTITDVTVARAFKNEMFNITLGCKNLFDVQNIRATSSGGVHSGGTGSAAVSTGRSFFLKLDFKFEK